jgi:hypothetical protein
MVPPEIVLDRYVRTKLVNEPGFASYLGKLNIDRVQSQSFASLLRAVQSTLNEALRLEGINASGGVAHPPFHFDFLDVSSYIANAHAFEHEEYAFIAITLPLVERLLHISERLVNFPSVLQLLHMDARTVETDTLQGFLCQIQLNFLVGHEYTHHIHKHLIYRQHGAIRVWTEFSGDPRSGNLDAQAQELDADGYAVYLVLAHLLRGERRRSALALWGIQDAVGTDTDELLLNAFFLSVMAFFCAFSTSAGADIKSLYESTHPPPAVRIKYAILVARMWSGQNASLPESWFNPVNMQPLFRAAIEVSGASKAIWQDQVSLLSSAAGEEYERLLFERFEAVRKGPSAH